jgi:hypothetical protein
MAKTTAPLLSFGAGGQIAKTQVYASWKGIPYVRRYVVPANPQSSGQTETRSVFTTLTQLWKNLTTDSVAPWSAYATGKPMTDRNAYLKFNVKILRPGDDWTGWLGSPGAGGGVPLTSLSATGGSGTIATTVGTPTPPTGWSLVAVNGVARINDDPHTTTDFSVETETTSSDPWEPAWSGLAAGDYIIECWPVWNTGNGVLAYGKSLEATATVS